MIASDLQVSLPTVNRRTSAIVAARLIARAGLSSLVLADDDGLPAAVIAPIDVLRLMQPGVEPVGKIGDLLDDDGAKVGPIVRLDPAASLPEVAARMTAARATVAVVDADPRSPRFVLLSVVIDAVLASRDDADESV